MVICGNGWNSTGIATGVVKYGVPLMIVLLIFLLTFLIPDHKDDPRADTNFTAGTTSSVTANSSDTGAETWLLDAENITSTSDTANDTWSMPLSPDYFEGDIMRLPVHQFPPKPFLAQAHSVEHSGLLWPKNGSIPYSFTDTKAPFFDFDEQNQIRAAMNAIAEVTRGGLKFVERTTEADYIEFVKDQDYCTSYVGKTGGQQPVLLTRECLLLVGVVQHEIMHALGFHHEHTRSDRDDYVTINWKNVDPERKTQLERGAGDNLMLPYDYSSIMHYGPHAFARKGHERLITIQPKKNVTIGQRENLSALDVAKIYSVYQCSIPAVESRVKLPEPMEYFENDPENTLGSTLHFQYTNLTEEQRRIQTSENCRPQKCLKFGCTGMKVYWIDCTEDAGVPEISNMALDILHLNSTHPVYIDLYDNKFLKQDVFLPIQTNVVHMGLIKCLARRSITRVRDMGFTNLLSIQLTRCKNLFIQKNDFKYNKQLRTIAFFDTTIRDLEQFAFEGLPELTQLWLEVGKDYIDWVSDVRFQAYVRRIHCDCSYSWLRDMYRRKPGLLDWSAWPDDHHPALRDLWRSSPRYFVNYWPVDCQYETEFPVRVDGRHREYSRNVECCRPDGITAEEETFMTKKLPRPTPMSPFAKLFPPTENCEDLGSDHCKPSACNRTWKVSVFCRAPVLKAEALRLSSKLSERSGFSVSIGGPDGHLLSHPVLWPICLQVTVLWIQDCVDIRPGSRLGRRHLENLLTVKFTFCYNLVLERDDFSHSPRLQEIYFSHSTFSDIQPYSFVNLPNLYKLGLELTDVLPPGYSASQMFGELLTFKYDQIIALHCDCKYSWLRRWLKQNPNLISPGGETNSSNADWVPTDRESGDMYISVDCSNRNPSLQKYESNGQPFSYNVVCC